MNTGIQDAANLGWKLAAAVHGMGSVRNCSTPTMPSDTRWAARCCAAAACSCGWP